jgi:hypothetical protein
MSVWVNSPWVDVGGDILVAQNLVPFASLFLQPPLFSLSFITQEMRLLYTIYIVR